MDIDRLFRDDRRILSQPWILYKDKRARLDTDAGI